MMSALPITVRGGVLGVVPKRTHLRTASIQVRDGGRQRHGSHATSTRAVRMEIAEMQVVSGTAPSFPFTQRPGSR